MTEAHCLGCSAPKNWLRSGWHKPVAQINWVENRVKGIVRGLHYQAAPHSETKILFCMAGAIHDVVVDVRSGSPGFLKPIAVNLEAEAGDGLLIPAGSLMAINV